MPLHLHKEGKQKPESAIKTLRVMWKKYVGQVERDREREGINLDCPISRVHVYMTGMERDYMSIVNKTSKILDRIYGFYIEENDNKLCQCERWLHIADDLLIQCELGN